MAEVEAAKSDEARAGSLERAIAIAARAHDGARDKGGAPYILHPIRVMMRLTEPEDRIVAILHDVVEDSEWTLDQLRMEGFPESVIDAVDSLTRRQGEEYFEFVRRAAQNDIGRRVKRCDLEDNMDLTRISEPTDRDRARLD